MWIVDAKGFIAVQKTLEKDALEALGAQVRALGAKKTIVIVEADPLGFLLELINPVFIGDSDVISVPNRHFLVKYPYPDPRKALCQDVMLPFECIFQGRKYNWDGDYLTCNGVRICATCFLYGIVRKNSYCLGESSEEISDDSEHEQAYKRVKMSHEFITNPTEMLPISLLNWTWSCSKKPLYAQVHDRKRGTFAYVIEAQVRTGLDHGWARLCANFACLKKACTDIVDTQRTKYCKECSKQFDKSWKALFDKKHKCKVLDCKAQRHGGEYCPRHAKKLDPSFKKREPRDCVSCKERYHAPGFKICTQCLKEQFPDEYEKAEIKCANKACTKERYLRALESKHTLYCTECAKIHDPQFFQLYRKSVSCSTPECQNARFSMSFDGSTAPLCLSCLRIKQPTFYEQYRSAKRCQIPGCTFVSTTVPSQAMSLKTMPLCLTCAKTHNPALYAACLAKELCQTPLCTSRLIHEAGCKFTLCVKCLKDKEPEAYLNLRERRACQSPGCDRLGKQKGGFCKRHAPSYVEAKAGTSKQSCNFLDLLEKELQCSVRHAHVTRTGIEGSEKRIMNFGIYGKQVDGWMEPNIVIEYLGSFWHGDPDMFDPEAINQITQKKYKDLYDQTMMKLNRMADLGYKVHFVWESEFTKWLKSSPKKPLQSIMHTIESQIEK
jgi:hypothetical protein